MNTTPEAMTDAATIAALCERLRVIADEEDKTTQFWSVDLPQFDGNPFRFALATIKALAAKLATVEVLTTQLAEDEEHIISCELTIAAVEAERDEAVARAEIEFGIRDMIHAMGERRATARIVADLRAKGRLLHGLADRYERGEHLKGESNG
jgi:hypothetical protein